MLDKKAAPPTEIASQFEFNIADLGNSRYTLNMLANKLGATVNCLNGKMKVFFRRPGNKAQLTIETFIRTGVIPNI